MATAIPQRFPTTRWWLLLQAGRGTPADRREAIEELFRVYASPIRAFVAASPGVRPADVDDVVQEFITVKWLEQGMLDQADPAKGRFRSFLVVALRRFVANWRQAARNRAGEPSPDRPNEAVEQSPDAERRFAQTFAVEVIHAAITRMQEECIRSGRSDVWGVFEARVVGPALHDAAPPSYDELLSRFGFTSPARAANLLVTGKRTFLRHLAETIALYEEDADDIDAEVAELLRNLSASG